MNVDRLAAQLEIDEDWRASIYQNSVYQNSVGKWTGGVGRNRSDRPFSEDEIDLLFKNDIDQVGRGRRAGRHP